jgi:hypothetical protein
VNELPNSCTVLVPAPSNEISTFVLPVQCNEYSSTVQFSYSYKYKKVPYSYSSIPVLGTTGTATGRISTSCTSTTWINKTVFVLRSSTCNPS